MKIETKFEVETNVWVIHNSKALKFPIHSAKVDIDKTCEISYFLNIGDAKVFSCGIFKECQCFKTRKELIEQL